MSQIEGALIHITGVVQGVGFRPFVYDLAQRFALTGWIRNTSAGVDIVVDGSNQAVQAFVRSLQQDAPPLARIHSFLVESREPDGFQAFEILPSQVVKDAYQPISPDMGLCEDCRTEMWDPGDRRFRYPFINCTNCGPRFTIITDVPYDRPFTTMASFPLCQDCEAEYLNPADRRFHAQPVACPACGPHTRLILGGESLWEGESSIQAARRFIKGGKILAIKGLGGFHLACDATNPIAVARLRRRKLRVDKPFAVMVPDITTAAAYCQLEHADTALLCSREKPVVIIARRQAVDNLLLPAIAAQVAPGQNTLGLMLPYTPLHALLLQPEPGFPPALVMTSGNLSDEPLATGNEEAQVRLDGLVDIFLVHNREIHIRCDDSVYRTFQSNPYPIRRARGFAPYPVRLPRSGPPILATGPELKNTFCLTREEDAFLSHHIGDLENFETLRSYEEAILHYQRLFRITPEILAHDLHPDYLATRYAISRGQRDEIPTVGVQHHHAHIAACMTEHELSGAEPVIGVAFDGTGYGEDGAIWGGEFLLADYLGYRRPYHLKYIPMPGGETAVKEPWRLALVWLQLSGLDVPDRLPLMREVDAHRRKVAINQARVGINAPLTSSMGRLFDAVAALLGVRLETNYEAQAAIELEARADPGETGVYEFDIGMGEIDPTPVFQGLVEAYLDGCPVEVLATRFHNSVSLMVADVCQELRRQCNIDQVLLSGGVWQNQLLLNSTYAHLTKRGFQVETHRQVPCNDGGVALGQAAVALAQQAGGTTAV